VRLLLLASQQERSASLDTATAIACCSPDASECRKRFFTLVHWPTLRHCWQHWKKVFYWTFTWVVALFYIVLWVRVVLTLDTRYGLAAATLLLF